MATIQKTNGWLNLFQAGTAGTNTIKISYVSLGTGTNAPTQGDTQLQNEVFRKPVTALVTGATGEIIINLYLGPNDAVNVDIEEIGFWAGNSASLTPNSGILVARGLWSHNPKTGIESITFALDAIIS